MKFDYYIFIDYSENFIGYVIIERENVIKLISKLTKFKHYNQAKNRRLYLKNIKKTIERENIKSYFYNFKISNTIKKIERYLELLEFLKKHFNNTIFISIDNREYNNFNKLINILSDKNITIVKERDLKKGSLEHRLSLILDNLLNIERMKNKIK